VVPELMENYGQNCHPSESRSVNIFKSDWSLSSATCCSWSCLSRRIGEGDLKRSLPTSTIPWSLNKLIHATSGKTLLAQLKLSVLITQLLLGSEQRQRELTTCMPDTTPMYSMFLQSSGLLHFCSI